MTKYIDIHALHTYPFVNLNRDDTGAPKSTVYGGANRVRVSSQALKRPTRLWAENEGLMSASTRTRHIDELIRERLKTGPLPEEDRDHAALIVSTAVKALSGKKGKDVLGFFGETELAGFVDLANSLEEAGKLKPGKGKKGDATTDAEKRVKDEVDRLVSHAESAVAMFGRMFAERSELRIDGAIQVAHAFTVHTASIEQDYFTAVEDWKADDDDSGSGAGHLSTNEYGGGTFYKYASVGVEELLRNVGGDVEAAKTLVAAFVRGFLLSTPTGKKNTTAGGGVPDLVYVAVQSRQPLSLAAAFEAPVKGRDGYRAPSARALASHASAVNAFTGVPPESAVFASTLSDDGVLHEELGKGLGKKVPGMVELVATAVGSLDGHA